MTESISFEVLSQAQETEKKRDLSFREAAAAVSLFLLAGYRNSVRKLE